MTNPQGAFSVTATVQSEADIVEGKLTIDANGYISYIDDLHFSKVNNFEIKNLKYWLKGKKFEGLVQGFVLDELKQPVFGALVTIQVKNEVDQV